jgi:hypothetical protein
MVIIHSSQPQNGSTRILVVVERGAWIVTITAFDDEPLREFGNPVTDEV